MTGARCKMLNFLPDTIKTFSENSQKTVGSLMKNMRVDKSQIAELVRNLATFSAGSTYVPTLSISRELIKSEFFVDFFRDLEIRFSRYFDATNSINVVINSMTEIILSQIAKAEKTISYYENYINNYEFLSGKDDLYNFSYVENFDSNLSSNEYETVKVPYIDRGGASFADNGNGYIDPVSSTFKIGSGLNITNIVNNIKEIKVSSNCQQYFSSSSDPKSLFNEDDSDVWSVSIKSPVVITSSIQDISKYVDYDYSYIVGAKTIVEISLAKEVEMDFVRILPSESTGLQLLQLAVESGNTMENTFSTYSSNSVSGYEVKKILKAPLLINSTLDINIPLDKIKKIILIFNQSTYTKSNNAPLVDELISRSISDHVSRSTKNRKNSYSVLQDIVIEYFRRDSSIDEFKRNNYNLSEYYSCKFPVDKQTLSASVKSNLDTEKNNYIGIDDEDSEFNNSPLTMLVQNIVSQVLSSRVNVFKNSMFKDTKVAYSQGRLSEMSSAPSSMSGDSSMLGYGHLGNTADHTLPGTSFGKTPLHNSNSTSLNNYEYSFGLKGIQVGKSVGVHRSGNTISMSKACFISGKIPVSGDVYAVKAKVNVDKNSLSYNIPSSDIKEPTSYELCVSFMENPSTENDWISIAPYGLDSIESEMLFVDPLSSTTKLRFFPKNTSIKIFEDQKLLPLNSYSFNKFDKSIVIFNFSKNSTYLASYELDKDNFSQDYIDVSVLGNPVRILGAGDQGADGEFFQRTGTENKVTLKKDAVIDHTRFVNATYSLTYGSVAAPEYSGYSPVIVKFADGSYAINLTNYLNGSFEKTNFYDTSETLFFQNGKSILFNKPVNQPFHVMYNYMNNYIRFRLITRNNFSNHFSSGSIDNVIIKMKTKSSDMNTQKLLQLG